VNDFFSWVKEVFLWLLPYFPWLLPLLIVLLGALSLLRFTGGGRTRSSRKRRVKSSGSSPNRLKVIWGNFTEGAMSRKFIVRLICAYTLWCLNFWVFAPRFVPDIVAKWWANEWALLSTAIVGVVIFVSATHEVRIKPDDSSDTRTVPRDYVMWYVLVPLTAFFVLWHFVEVFQ
jgi:hypothetical protein